MTQHKWHKEIKAWADGADIEVSMLCQTGHGEWGWSEWTADINPEWEIVEYQYRIKQQPVEVVASAHAFRFKEKKYLYAYIDTRFGKIEFSTEWDKTSAMPLLGKIEVQDD